MAFGVADACDAWRGTAVPSTFSMATGMAIGTGSGLGIVVVGESMLANGHVGSWLLKFRHLRNVETEHVFRACWQV